MQGTAGATLLDPNLHLGNRPVALFRIRIGLPSPNKVLADTSAMEPPNTASHTDHRTKTMRNTQLSDTDFSIQPEFSPKEGRVDKIRIIATIAPDPRP